MPKPARSVEMFDDLSPEAQDAKAQVDAVGQAILGLDEAGSPMTADNARAEAWWDKLSAAEMVTALYGDGADTNRRHRRNEHAGC